MRFTIIAAFPSAGCARIALSHPGGNGLFQETGFLPALEITMLQHQWHAGRNGRDMVRKKAAHEREVPEPETYLRGTVVRIDIDSKFAYIAYGAGRDARLSPKVAQQCGVPIEQLGERMIVEIMIETGLDGNPKVSRIRKL